MARQKEKKDWSGWVIAAVAIASLAGAKVYDTFAFKESVATKPYVDDRFIEGKKYTDERAALMFERAVAHSDANHQDMMLKLEQLNTENRSFQATMSTKIEAILNAVPKSGHWRNDKSF